LILLAAENGEVKNQIFFAGDGNIYKFEDFIVAVEKAMGKKVIKLHIPIFLSYLLALFNEGMKYFNKKAGNNKHAESQRNAPVLLVV